MSQRTCLETPYWEMTRDVFDFSDLDIHDDHLHIDSVLSSTTVAAFTKFKVDKTNSLGSNVWKPSEDLFDVSYPEIQDAT